MHKFCHWDRLREKVSCLLNKQLLPSAFSAIIIHAIRERRNMFTLRNEPFPILTISTAWLKCSSTFIPFLRLLWWLYLWPFGISNKQNSPLHHKGHGNSNIHFRSRPFGVYSQMMEPSEVYCHFLPCCNYSLAYSTRPNSFRYTSISLSNSARLASSSFISAITALMSIGSSSSKVST